MRRYCLAALLLVAALLAACGGGGGKKPATTTPGSRIIPTDDVTLPLRPDQIALYSVNADGSGLRKLFDEGDFLNASLSPDGSRLALMSVQGSDAVVYVLDADGGERKEIARIRGYLGGLLWSPDGARLVFTLQPASTDVPAEPPTTYLYSRESGALDELFSRVDTSVQSWTPDGTGLFFLEGPYPRDLKRLDLATRRETELLRDFAFNDVAISPDGRQVAVTSFDSDEGSASGTGRLTLLQADGSGQRELLTVEETQGLGYGGVAWSPDGGRIAYSRMVFGDNGPRGSYTVDVATGATTRLTAPTQGFDSGVTWSQDSSLLFISRLGCIQCDGGGAKVVLAVADGSGEVPLPGTDQFEFASSQAVWSPDGTRFAYGGDRLYVAGAGGTAARPIADLPASTYTPVGWSNASTILFTRLPDAATAVYAAQPDGSGFELLHLGNGAVAPDGETVAELTEDGLVISAPGEPDVTVPRGRLEALGPAGWSDGQLSWSPDSSRVAIASGFKEGAGIIVADRDGKLTLVTGASRDGEIRWSPDGSRIAYWSESALWTAGPSGGAPERLISVATAPGFDWSPDGERLAFFAGTDVRAVSAHGGTSEFLFAAALQQYSSKSLRWSPDGRRIAVTTGRDIAIGEVEMAQVIQAAADVADVAGFDWTSDGAALAFGGYLVQSGTGHPGVYLVAADGGGQLTALTYSSGRRHEVLGRLADGRLVFASQFQL